MKILQDKWSDGFLDPALTENSARIEVHLWCNLSPLNDLYFRPQGGWRLLWNYTREFGVRQVVRKSLSRVKERSRNQKFLAVGAGQVMESSDDRFPLGAWAVFIATMHPKCMERIVVSGDLLRKMDSPLDLPDGEIALLEGAATPGITELGGWNPESGIPLPPSLLSQALQEADEIVRRANLSGVSRLSVSPSSSLLERTPSPPARTGRLSAVLFGYGHYAKTNILPNLGDKITVAAVHEVDPTQLGAVSALPFATDSSPILRAEERYDVCFLAGYHHTHAPLATEAIKRGMVAVSEKPLATTTHDLEELLRALKNGGKFYAGFHKRYSELNPVALKFLRRGANAVPISYHCIVHEVPLPARHWYTWPNSKSRVVSNGCHWMDHWMFLNDYSPVARHTATRLASGDVVVAAQAVNGAGFVMTLTDLGSSRIGVEDTVELRTPDVTVRIFNGASLVAEDSTRVLARVRVNRTASYARMYQQIAHNIASGAPGDSIESIERSTRFVLDVEASLETS